MNTIIEMAKNRLSLNMPEIIDIDMLEMEIKKFLEMCLHDVFDDNEMIAHGDVEIRVTRAHGSEDRTIKILHGDAYIVLYQYGRGNVYTIARNYWTAFRDTFRSAFIDENYVDSVIYNLIMLLVENHFVYLV